MSTIETANVTLPLTKNQNSLWLDTIISEDKALYVIGGYAEIKQDLSIDAFQIALQKVISEIDAMGISIHEKEESPVQVISPQLGYELPLLDFSDDLSPKESCQNWIKEQLDTPFMLQQPPLYEFALLKASKNHFFWMMKIHHLLIDTWGVALFVNKLDEYYHDYHRHPHGTNAASLSASSQQSPLFEAYVLQENAYQNTVAHTEDRHYWVEKFTQLPPRLLEKKTNTAPAVGNMEKSWVIPSALQGAMYDLANKNNISIPQLWMGIIATYFYKTTQKETLCFGLPIANRNTQAESNTIGLFNGVIPLLLNVSAELTFEALLRQIKSTRSNDRPHQQFSLPELLHEVRHLSTATPSLFDVSINIDNLVCQFEGLESEFIWLKRGGERKTPMTFFIKPSGKGKGWEVKVAFLANYCSESEAERLLLRVKALINTLLKNPKQCLYAVNILPEGEQQLLLEGFNHTDASYPRNKTIVDLFEEQVANTSTHIAVIYQDKALTYQALNEKANRVAQYLLQKYAIQPDDIIGLQVSRSEWMLVGILGILKAGAAYLPMGSDLPKVRVAFMLEDSAAKALLTDQSSQSIATTFENITPVLIIEHIVEQNKSSTFQNLKTTLKPSNLAYIIYTSGSTGKPKGVMIEHRNVVRLMVNDQSLFDFNETDVWTLFHYYGFDFSVWEIWGALLFGGKVVVVPQSATLNPEAFADLLLQEQVTVLNQVSSTFDQVQVHLLKKAANDRMNIRYIIFGGAKLVPATLRAWKTRFPATRLINMYGITETTVHVTYKEINQKEIQVGISNVGRAIPTLRCYILDTHLNLAPIGVVGEIYVAGDGLARGYLNNPELTATYFIEKGFEPETRLYKSGDSGRWLANGDIEFFGRLDFQLKIRGFRIEAGEIEQKLLEHPVIHSAVVLGKEIKGTTELVAYLTCNEQKVISLQSLRTYLSNDLPSYMVPAYFVQMETLPLTKNGKIDRKALPEPDGLSINSGVEFIAPRNTIEGKIVAAFAEILGLAAPTISIQDDFFNLGGDSIKLIRLVAYIHRELGIKLPLENVYVSSNIVALADYIIENTQILESKQVNYKQQQQALEAQFSVLKKNVLAEQKANNKDSHIAAVFPMSDIQKGMVFGNLLYENEGVYHDQAVYALDSIGFEKTRFEKALALMVAKHATLRTAFRLNDQRGDIQLVYENINLPISYQKTEYLQKDELEQVLASFLQKERQKGFDIAQAGLWRMRIFQSATAHPVLVLQFHHAIFDGWSLASFNTELLTIYHQLAANPHYQPISLSLSYQDFVIREQITKQDEAIQHFWQHELADYERADLFTEEVVDDECEINIGGTYLKCLKILAERYGVSVKILTLSTYLLLLDFLSYQSKTVIGVISTNRLPEEEGDQLLGCFLNSVPLKVPVDKKRVAPDFIHQVNEKIQSLRGKDQLTTMEIAKLIGETSVEDNPIFDVIFNYIDFHIYDTLDDIGMTANQMMQADLKGIPPFFERTNTYFDLTVNTTGNELTLKIQLSKQLKAGYSAQQIIDKYIRILDILQEQPTTNIGAIDVLNDEERNQLLTVFNPTRYKGEASYTPEKTIIDLFEEQAVKTPHKIALVFDETEVTYQTLEKRSRQLALYLRKHGVQTDTLVGLCMHRSIEMMVAILGILRAGGAYVPLDPNYPKERVVYMLQDGIIKGNKEGDAKIILTQEGLRSLVTDNIDELEIRLIALSAHWEENEWVATIKGTLDHKPAAQDLIYVIFTSGSTGKPKGTLVQHQGFYNLMHWYLNDFDFNEDSQFLLVSSINFDLTQKNLYAPLLLGGSLHISSAENYDLVAITNIIKKHHITNINCTPSIFYGFVEEAESQQFIPLQSLEYVFLGGEPINLLKLRRWFNNPHNNATLVNSYGPTECSDVVSHYVIENSEIATIPIGKPICNTQLYVLDTQQTLVPLGVQGELCIGGKGVGRGYLNNPDLTKQTFIANPFKAGELLYQTGDLARVLPDGNIEFLGRTDHQLKIRGHRIEAGDIEDVLQKHVAIQSVIVVGKDIADSKELIAYFVVSSEEKSPTLEILHSSLSEHLPDYMVPAYFVELAALPLTPSGKVNTRALPEPTVNSLASSIAYIAPRTRTEAALSRIWEEVLQKDAIGIYDNFFNVGGHSLRAIRLVSLIQQELSVGIKLSDVFTYPTIATLAPHISSKNKMRFAAIESVEVQEHYRVSNAQRRLWLVAQMEEEQTVYNMPMVLRLKGILSVKALHFAFETLVNRHESLRTNIITVEGQPRQLIHAVGQCDMPVIHFERDNVDALSDYMLNFAQRSYDLAKDNLFRIKLLQLDTQEHLLLFNIHHIVFDGWSMQQLLQELEQLYVAYIKEQANSLPLLTIHYKDYAAWQNALLQESKLINDLRTYWHHKLAPTDEGIPVLELPEDYARPAIQTYQGATLTKTLSLPVSKGLEELCQSVGATLFMGLTALVKVLLYRYSNQRDILVGTPSAGRGHPDLDNQLGFYVNILVLRDYLQADMSFVDFLVNVKQTNMEAIEHELYPFDLLVEELDLTRDRSRSPLFDVLLVFQNDEPSTLSFGGVDVNLEMIDWQTSKFDLTFGFVASEQGITTHIEYNTALYKAERIQRMFGHLECLLGSIMEDAKQPIDNLNLLSSIETQQIFNNVMGTRITYNVDQTITQVIETQVEKTPDNVAIIFEDKALTYRTLNKRANKLAHYLIANFKCKGDDIIALQVERSEWMMIALLGVMKAGAAYLPIAPDYPENRTAFMLEDSAARLLLTDSSTYEIAKTAFNQLLPVVAVEAAQDETHTSNPVTDVNGYNLAYLIYTSGSTGQPKGVMLEHRGVVNMLYGQIERLEVTAKDRTLQFAPYTFDASVAELYMGLCVGAMMVLVNRETLLSTDAFQALIHQYEITIADVPPAYLSVLDETALDKARILITAGEAAISNDVKKYIDKLEYVNIYGPTETTVVACSFKIPSSYQLGQNVPIGRPVPNMDIFIVDAHRQLVPIGVSGEMAIGGIGLARGYLNNEALTASKFVPHPFNAGERLYLTGDLGRWLDDGNIEFVGRIDHQLKIRGHRIEAGEIEEALLQHQSIQSAVVIGKTIKSNKGKGRSTKELVAYLIANETATLELTNLRDYLGESLPDYMIPAYFIVLEALPLTRHEKINRKALPEPNALNTLASTTYTAPVSDMEILLVNIWEEVLHRPTIGIHDNFFHIGGDSIKALQISGRLGAMGLSLSIKALFFQPTIAQLALSIKKKEQHYPQERLSGEVSLTAIQYWFFDQIHVDKHHFNQSFILKSQKDKDLDASLLQQSLTAVIVQHDLLRASYAQKEDVFLQTIRDEASFNFQSVILKQDIEEASLIAHHINKAQTGFNLTTGSLVNAVLFKKPTGDELLIVIHHLVVDGVSWRIILEDLTTAYKQLEAGKVVRLAPKTAPFSLWSEQISQYANSPIGLTQRKYWDEQVSCPVDTFAVDYPHQPNCAGESETIQFQLNKKQTYRLLEQTNQAYNTEINDVLLCALSRALHKVFGGTHYQITLEGHGREPLFEMDISRTVGWFTSIFPVVLEYGEALDHHLQTIKEHLHRIPNKGMDYLLLHYMSEKPFSQTMSNTISFNYLGDFAQEQSNALLHFSDSETGASVSPAIARDCELDIVGIVMHGQLQLSITYGQQRMKKVKIQSLATAFKDELSALIEHCIARKRPQLTPTDFTACDLSLDQYEQFLQTNKLSAEAIDDIYTLSPLQEGILFHKLMDPDSPAYFNQVELLISTAIDIPHFVYCWEQIINAHPVLRTSFFSEGLSAPLQVVNKAVDINFISKNLLEYDANAQECIIQEYVLADREKIFDLSDQSLLRLALFQTGIAQFRLVVSDSHITMDGWSQAVLLQDLKRLYRGDLSTLKAKPYSPYIAWLKAQPGHESEAFWRTYLAGYEETASIPKLKTTASTEAIDTQTETLLLSEIQTSALEDLAKAYQVSLNTVIQGIWAVVLGVYTQKEDVVFGMTTSGRSAPIKDIEALSGLFINTIPLRIVWSANDSFTDLLNNIQQSALSIQEHEHYSLALIQAEWDGQRELIDHMIAFENYPAEETKGVKQEGLNIKHTAGYDPIHYDFGLVVAPGKQLRIHLNYNQAVVATDWVKYIKSHIATAMTQVLEAPKQLVRQITIIPSSERHLLVQGVNDRKANFPYQKTTVDLFEEQVLKTPDNIALVFENKQLTYRELNEKSNRLAHALRLRYAIQPDDIIALQLERSEWILIAILGVLKAGAAYLPIATDFPPSRVKYMLQNSQAKALLVDESIYDSAKENTTILPVVSVESIKSEKIENLVPIADSHNLAYIIYTSGSTGQPKGVMIEHRNVVRLIINDQSLFDFDAYDVWTLFHYYGFDISVWEIWGALLFGGKIILVPKQTTLNPEAFADLLVEQQVTVLNQVPSSFEQVQGYLLKKAKSSIKLRYIIFGGAKLLPIILSQWKQYFPDTKLINMYGITETTVHVTYKELGKKDIETGISNIGCALPTLRCYILNGRLEPVPVGVVGEIYVAGDGLARGYLNNPELTAMRFIASPFEQGERLYQSGDSARRLTNGDIEFFERIDFQLKIRGFRIEAGEIEQTLLEHPAIHSCVIIGKQINTTTELVAYLVVNKGETLPDITALRAFLGEKLPPYMIPSYFMELEHLPLTMNGKIDQKALPKLVTSELASGKEYIAPRTTTEQQLTAIWADVLARQNISVDDNFFSLGGHSLKAIRLLGQIQEKMERQLPLQLLFQHPILADQALQLDSLGDDKEKTSHQQGMRFNANAKPTLFTFPPFFGLSVWYQQLASQLPDVSFYCFDFLLDENRLEQYYEQIKKEQIDGPYVLFGYSAGGSLAYEMAAYMEAKGEKVAGVIMGDSMVVSAMKTDLEGYLGDLATALSTRGDEATSGLLVLINNKILRKQSLERLAAYEDFLNNANNHSIQADIHLIKAEFAADIPTMHQRWGEYTNGAYTLYQASGSHDYLFELPHLESNAVILQRLVEKSLNTVLSIDFSII